MDRFLVLLGGLTDGLMFAPYVEPLAVATAQMGWTLVQGQVSSSYQGFGCCNLDGDADELHMLCSHLSSLSLPDSSHDQQADGGTAARSDACAVNTGSCIALMGHSTGCQIICRYLQRRARGQYGAGTEALLPIRGVVLQAPVSDREVRMRQIWYLMLFFQARRWVWAVVNM